MVSGLAKSYIFPSFYNIPLEERCCYWSSVRVNQIQFVSFERKQCFSTIYILFVVDNLWMTSELRPTKAFSTEVFLKTLSADDQGKMYSKGTLFSKKVVFITNQRGSIPS